ncbi:sugar ABC transporter ATP-binding protein [Dyadobacter fanqingshengii]|uniref:Sugar ABC transporter ATP-binding protein n=1 Tax=Dyadobacter fanqingshengii TaxID=2906443 RepID=A0A9X1T8V9_9BACT|nr:sugar ABC transporter ATP-binding protein [Dyadobacter fanqingshengii]MCF0040550.1 sugar ABC transporter ATP-binding protein [Dyadobacter fanqingshengii]USJ37711.1 sugar ABC transporter ATP-binding protein [Dyadobacter fanqingshengii]
MLEVNNITKRFPGVIALENVCLSIEAGKVTALIGENGAGKSTLMKILSGVYQDFEGEIHLKGEPVKFAGPKDAQQKGIAIIHQELNLIPYLTITENIFLGREMLTQFGTIDKNRMRKKTQELLDRLKLKVKPETQVVKLKVGQQQIVEIAKSLLTDAELIIMDEPTSAITGSEVDLLFDIIENLRNEGKAIIYVSHKLDELFRIADHYVVLRDGKSIESGRMEGITQDQLIAKMVGRKIEIMRRSTGAAKCETLLEVNNLTLKHPVRPKEDLLKDISFKICKGEIVGIFGLMGAGRTELLETIFGLHASGVSGHISMEGKELKCASPSEAITAGLALVPEDRKKDGLVLGLDVKTNISLTTLPDLEKLGTLSDAKEVALADKYIGELQIKTSSKTQKAKNLSGGNQQKIVLAKWLATKPKLLLLDEPTRGIDINAKNEIYKLIIKLAEAGLGIVVVSSELPEILAVSDRVLVMAEGALTAGFTIDEATEDSILRAAIPQSNFEIKA